MDLERVARVRQLLGEVAQGHAALLRASIDAALAEVPAIRMAAEQPAAYPIFRRRLLCLVSQKSKHYGLADEVLAFTLAAGYETANGLDLAQLEALDRWLDGIIDRLQMACDSPDSPPAR